MTNEWYLIAVFLLLLWGLTLVVHKLHPKYKAVLRMLASLGLLVLVATHWSSDNKGPAILLIAIAISGLIQGGYLWKQTRQNINQTNS